MTFLVHVNACQTNVPANGSWERTKPHFLILHGTRESTVGFKVVILRLKEGQIAFDVS